MTNRQPSYHGYRFPSQIISHAVWLYHRFCLSFREVEDLLAERGVTVSYESIRQWCLQFGLEYARRLKRRRERLGDTWYIDEVFITIRGERYYSWRAVDQDGDVIDILVQRRRNRHAAKRFFRKVLKAQGSVPRKIVTDKLRSDGAVHRAVMPPVIHSTEQYENNRAEASHQPTRQRERHMRHFKSPGQAQRFLTIHGAVQNLFRVGRHLTRAPHNRLFRARAFVDWQRVTCALEGTNGVSAASSHPWFDVLTVPLAAGYPIASGVIEWACRHVVKDRMERSGMRWVLKGAHAMLSLGSIHLSGLWEEFMRFHIDRECQRLYPNRAANDADMLLPLVA